MEHEILSGEVWAEERGRAVVGLPDHVHGRELEFECRLHDVGAAGACTELSHGRPTITSPLPHLKVAWRLHRRRGATQSRTKEF